MDNNQLSNRMHIYGYAVYKPTRTINYKLSDRIKRAIKHKTIKLLFVKSEVVEIPRVTINA